MDVANVLKMVSGEVGAISKGDMVTDTRPPISNRVTHKAEYAGSVTNATGDGERMKGAGDSTEPIDFSKFFDSFIYVATMGFAVDTANWLVSASRRFAVLAPELAKMPAERAGFELYMDECERTQGDSDRQGCDGEYDGAAKEYVNECFRTEGANDPGGCREYASWENYQDEQEKIREEGDPYANFVYP